MRPWKRGVPAVTDDEIKIVADFIVRFREYSKTQPVGAATVALGIPALGQLPRIRLVLAEMETRGLLVRASHDNGASVYMEADLREA
jgi:hypothetical protein